MTGQESVLRSPRALNILRGALGAALRQADCPSACSNPTACPESRQCQYRRWFTPRWSEGPSGYREAPRPFVLRTVSGTAPTSAAFQLIVFANSWPVVELADAMAAALQHLASGLTPRLSSVQHFTFPIDLPIESGAPELNDTLRICFDTPVEIKDRGLIAERPEFSVLMARLAERVWGLGTLYNGWSAGFFPNPLVDLSKQVQLIAHDWLRSESSRRSARSNSIHSLGGFTGWADYRGPIAPFLPLLSIGVWTGVGRQTVWGKGAFHLERIAAPTIPTLPLA